LELTELIKKTAQNIHRLNTAKQKALEAELNTDSHCSRAKRTTLVANSYKATSSYSQLVEDFKIMVSKL
jgi:hypothetical protein